MPTIKPRRTTRHLLSSLLSASILLTSVNAAAECAADAEMANLEFTLKDMNGNDVYLAEHLGNVMLIDFWATWCAPCRIEIPGFIEMFDDYEAQGFSVFGISLDDTPEALQAYAEEMGMDYNVLVGDGRDDVKEALGPIIGVPTALIIDRDGKVCHKHSGFAPKEQFVAEIESLL